MESERVNNYRRKPLLSAVGVAGCLLIIMSLLVYQRYRIFSKMADEGLVIAATEKWNYLQHKLNDAKAATASVSYIVKKYSIGNDFDDVAKEILSDNPSIAALALVEGDTVSHLYPASGAGLAKGQNIFEEGRLDRQEFNKLSRAPIHFALRYKMQDGQNALLSCLPVYRNGKYCGLATALLKPSIFFEDTKAHTQYRFQISGKDASTGEEYFLLPDTAQFRKGAGKYFAIAQDRWKVYVAPAKPESVPVLIPVIILGLLLSVLGGYATWSIMMVPARLRILVNEKVRQLGLSEKKYHNLFERASDAIIICAEDLTIISANKAASALLRYPEGQLQGLNIINLFEEECLKSLPLQNDEIRRGEHVAATRIVVRNDGSLLQVESNANLIEQDKIMVMMRDVTDMREAQRQLTHSELMLRNSFEHSAIGMAMVSLDGRWLKVNRELCRIVGYTEQELLSRTFMDITYPEDLYKDLDYVAKALSKELETYSVEKRYLHKNGSITWVSINSSIVRNNEGAALHFVTQIEDISEKKKLTGELSVKENQLNMFVNYSPAAVAMFDLDMRYVLRSHRWDTDYNLEGLDILGKSHYEIFPNVSDQWKEIHRRCLAGSIEKCEEDSYLRNDGTLRWIRWEVRPWHSESGAVGGVILLTEDITERRESAQNYQLLVEKALVGVYIIQDGIFVYVNPRFAEIFGYRPEEMLDGMPATTVVADEDKEYVADLLRKRVDGDMESVHYEARGRRPDGRDLWMEVNGSATQYRGERAIIGTLQDITDRKNAERMILHEKTLSETIINNLPGVFYVADKDRRFLRWNRNLEELSGYNRDEIAQMHTTDLVDRTHVDLSQQKRQEAIATGRASTELKVITKSKEELTYYISIMPLVYNGQNCVLGIGIDFTEKKAAEIVLKKKNAEIKERVKELKCLYTLSEISNSDKYSIDEIMQECATILPHAYQYPDIACALVIFGEKQYRSQGYEETKWRQDAIITINGRYVGNVRVYYKEERPKESEGPFLTEERYLINSIVDILGNAIERRTSNEEIIKLNRLYQFTSAINEMILRAVDSETILREACEIAVKYGKFRMAWIGHVDIENRCLRPCAIAGHDEGYLDAARMQPDFHTYGGGPSGLAILTRTHQYSNDIANDPSMGHWRTEALKRGYGSTIALPVIVDSKLVALYTLYMSDTFFFNEGEIKLLKDVTENIAYALDKFRLNALRKQAQIELRESEEKFRKLVEEALMGVFILQDYKFIYVNPALERISGYTSEELLNNISFEQLVHEDDISRVLTNHLARQAGGQPANQYTFKATRKDGTTRNIELMASEISYGAKPALIGTIIDITEKVEEEQRIGRAVSNAQESERLSIGMELHDNVKQILATSMLGLYMVKNSLDDRDAVAAHLTNVQRQMRDAIREIRRISHQLAPSIDPSLPLEEKIKDLTGSMNLSNNLALSFDFDPLEKPVNHDIQLALYRIVQEQMTNIIKYAKASTVSITLHHTEGKLTLSINDNGIGFDPCAKKNGIGLVNIRRRMTALNGKVNILSTPGNGCNLIVELPV